MAFSGDFYEQYEQTILIVPEESYGKPYQGTAFTALSANYPFASKLNIIADGTDVPIPIILKEKLYDIGSGKYPSHIANKNQEPVSFSVDMKMQDAKMLAYAFGTVATTHDLDGDELPQITEITPVADVAGSLNDTYFLLFGIDSSGDEIGYCVWFDVDSGGSAPAIIAAYSNITGVEIDISAGDSVADICDDLVTALDALDPFNVTDYTTYVEIEGAYDGAVIQARDSGTAASGFTFEVTQRGLSKHTVTETIGRELKSLTMHCEQINTDDNETIAYDLFGVVINSIEVTGNFADGLITATVEFTAPHYAIGNVFTEKPNDNKCNDPLVWANMKESANNCFIQEGDTATVNTPPPATGNPTGGDMTPKALESFTFTVTNNVDFKPDIGLNYMKHAYSTKRELSLTFTGFIDNKRLMDRWRDTWDNCRGVYSGAYNSSSGTAHRLNSTLTFERTADTDYIQLKIYNWMIGEHDLHFHSIDEGIKGINATLTDATPNSNKRQVSLFEEVNNLSKLTYQNA